ncbi:hypothetical protein Tco_0633626 [Tanacetum coccineum]
MTSFNQRECKGCGQPCDGFYCYLCTCQQCGVKLINGICLNCTYGDGKPVTCCGCEGPLNGGFCSFCASRAGNSFAYDPNLNSFNNSQNLSDYPPQPQYQTYSCELCGNDAHYGYDCPPQVPFVYNQVPCFNQNFDNIFSQTSPSFLQKYLCCENCEGPHATFQCQPMNQKFFDIFSRFLTNFIQPPPYHRIHASSSRNECSSQRKPNEIYTNLFKEVLIRISLQKTLKVLLLAWENFFEIKHAFKEKQHQPEDIQELLRKLLKDLQIISEELADYINTPNWNFPAFYDNDDEDDDEEYTIAITTVLPTMEPDNSLSMGDEHLSTIPETKSDEVIKSSVEDFVPIPSESEGISDNMCDVYFWDNSPPHDVLNDHFEIFFDFKNDCTSSDDDSFEDIDYVEASPPDTELVSLEEVTDDILREKLLNINLLIAKIESLNDNPTPDCVLKSPSPFHIPVEDSDSFFEKSDTSLSYSDNSLPEFENFSYHTEEY